MTEYEKRGAEIRMLSKSLILQFMQRHIDCGPDKQGLSFTEIFRMCGFDSGDYENVKSSQQQYWSFALIRELEAEGKVWRDMNKKWKLK